MNQEERYKSCYPQIEKDCSHHFFFHRRSFSHRLFHLAIWNLTMRHGSISFTTRLRLGGEKLASKNSQAISWFKGQFILNFSYSTFWFDQNPTTIWIGKCKIFSGISDTFVQIVLRNLCLTLLMSLTLIGINYKSKKMLIFSATSGFYL